MWKLAALFAGMAMVICGCHGRVEAHHEHVLHSAEHAQLLHSPRNPVCLAVAKKDVHLVTHAVENKDEAVLKQLLQEGRAFETSSATKVLIEHDAFSERGVLISDGTEKGKRGWVPYEWLTPLETAR